uniref:Lines homolog 1 n=1 Tax=Anolis carolinensis TaxID=28377 RepID=A0A803T6E9_ANOCA
MMGTPFFLLGQMYNDVLADGPLPTDNHECAALLDPYVSDLSGENKKLCLFSLEPDIQKSTLDSLAFKVDDESENENQSRHQTEEVTLLQLTLIKMILAKMQSQKLAVGIKCKYLEIVRILLEEAHIDSKLHLLNNAWLAFSSEALLGFPSGDWITECLSTLTNMIKEILKDEGFCKRGDLKMVLMPLDEILKGFYDSVMFCYSDIPQDYPISAKATNDLSSFLDVLELLVASRIQLPLNLSCQRMLFLNASFILGLATAPVHDFIKKKSIVLLKKCILHKAGEDLIKRKMPPSSYQDSYISADTSVLAGAVLQSVNSGWLNRLIVSEKSSHFGGTLVKPEESPCSSADQVTLGALSLVFLKALEIKILDSEAETQVHLENVMSPLLMFLKRYLRPSACVHPLGHLCMWLSVLFIEQDDDLFEASKALLTIHVKIERVWHDIGSTASHLDYETWTHQNGCNPHCIFLFLLKSIAFDATVLLDFLISSETCFLEYFVRYLKLLVENWHQFVQICRFLKPTAYGDTGFPLLSQRKGSYHFDSSLQSDSCDPQPCTVMLLTTSTKLSSSWPMDSQSARATRTTLLQGFDNTSLLEPLQRLVDYESSDDSETECIGEECLAETEQQSLNHQSCPDESNIMEVDDEAGASKQTVLFLDHENVNAASTSGCQISPDILGSEEEMLQKSVKCFQELQVLVSKLYKRNLFPYNPNALLKLLTQIAAVSKAYKSKDIQCRHPNVSPPTC